LSSRPARRSRRVTGEDTPLAIDLARPAT